MLFDLGFGDWGKGGQTALGAARDITLKLDERPLEEISDGRLCSTLIE